MKLSLFTLSLFVSAVCFSAPQTIRLQGRLTDSRGNPVVGPGILVRFEIFGADTGGTSLWGPSDQSVPTNDAGLFATDITGLSSGLFAQHDDLFLEVSVNEFGIWKKMRPRQHLVSVPYSLQSENARTADMAIAVGSGTVSSPQIVDHSITSDDIAPGAVGPAELRAGSVGATHLAPDSVGPAALHDRSVNSVKLSTDAVDSSNIRERSIRAIDIEEGAITGTELALVTIVSTHIAPGSIDATRIKPKTITSNEINDQAIQAGNLSVDVVNRLLPAGMIAMFSQACPSGWTRFDGLDNRFPMGVPSYSGTPGGSKVISGLTTDSTGAHVHTVNSHSHGVGTLSLGQPTTVLTDYKSQGGGWAAGFNHSHPISGQTGESAPPTDSQGAHKHTITSDGTWSPPYLGVVYCQKN